MHRNRGHVGAGCHRGHRKTATEIEVGAMGLIGEAEHAGIMGHTHDGAKVTADAIVGRVVYQHGDRLRMLGDGLRHLLTLHAETDAEAGVHLRIHIDRHGTAEHQRVQDAAVYVSRQDDLIAALAGGQHHALYGARRTADHQEGVGCAEGIGRQLLCFPNHRHRMAEIIEGLHAVDVDADALLPQERRQLWVAAATLVPRHIKRDHTHAPEVLQRLVDRCTPLIQARAFRISIHVLPPFVAPP